MDTTSSVGALLEKLDIGPSELARRLGVSSGHASDLLSGRRKPSLPIAVKLDELAGEPRFLPSVLARKMAGRAG